MSSFIVRAVIEGELRDISLPVAGDTLAQAIYLSGIFPSPALCSGLGRCGRCRVRYRDDPPPVLDREREVLSHHDLDNGWRLSCLRKAEDGLRVALPPPDPGARNAPVPAIKGPYALAVDLGTTSVWWRALPESRAENMEGPPGAEILEGRAPNPQMGAGSDVISRIAFALEPEGRARLRSLALDALCRAALRYGSLPQTLCVAANPAMTCILLDKDPAPLARAPYSLPYAGGVWESLPLKEAGSDEERALQTWIAPLVSPFIGGDISAGYASLAFDPDREAPAFPFLLADLGTNGELVLALSPTEALAASVAMGPALEGVNLTFGMDASFGAVTGYSITAHGLEPRVMGDTAPRGITGTGYLSLLRALKTAGMLSEEGFFLRPGRPGMTASPLARRLDGSFAALPERSPGREAERSPDASSGVPATGNAPGAAPRLLEDRLRPVEDRLRPAEDRLRLPGKMFMTASDVEELLKAKAAFSLAFSRLLREAGLAPSALKKVYLAGALGFHASPRALEDLGFIPPGLGARVLPVGNSSLAGAALCARSASVRDKTVAWAGFVTPCNLAGDASFAAGFAAHMRFSWQQ